MGRPRFASNRSPAPVATSALTRAMGSLTTNCPPEETIAKILSCTFRAAAPKKAAAGLALRDARLTGECFDDDREPLLGLIFRIHHRLPFAWQSGSFMNDARYPRNPFCVVHRPVGAKVSAAAAVARLS